MKLKIKIVLGYFVMLIVGISVTIILVHERHRMREIEAESAEIRQLRRDINTAHRHIT